ncbi:protein MULTIPLE CHLOROPLAST DIVISION SITE 1-like isoform X1 [Musa acuminata AAA Group]|uniref:protein MULTIPLE CHLOROPLAST DIVISION SITE 1-like isoform X1 n=1 Tax=Musa acuminata AAA Group TaxID=214697 RepID=UPI0031DC9729
MTSIANSIYFLPFQSIYSQNHFRDDKGWNSANLCWFRFDSPRPKWNCGRSRWVFAIRASALDSAGNDGPSVPVDGKGLDWERRINSFRDMVNALPPATLVFKGTTPSKSVLILSIAIAILAIAARRIMLKKKDHSYQGSVADLVRRGQLRSDRRGISKPMKYDDPFNNPFVKIDKSSSTVEMFGKLYRLAPVTLTTEQKSVHQKRRSRVYQWKRPTVFLKEGDSIPPDIDPDTVRWIPANHPFATTVSDIDEDLAQNNVYQKDGVPFRVKAEHEAMQKKLQALQNQEQRFNEVAINLNNIRDFERPSQSVKPHEQLEQDSSIYQQNSPINEGVDSSADNHQRN